MTEPFDAVRSRTDAAIDAWCVFWFRPKPAYPLGLIRIAFGVIAIGWALSLIADLENFFGVSGLAPRQPPGSFETGVFDIWTSDRAVMVGWTMLLVAAVALTVGWHSRLAALLVFVLIVSFEYRNPYIFNSGDNLIRVEALFLALSPCGAALSLDQRRRTGTFWTAQTRAVWPLRLLQIQLTLVYVTTFVTRMTGEKWPEGTALSYALRLHDMLIIPVPQWVSTNALVMNGATWAVLLLELLLGILIWNRRCRPVVMIAGVALHTAIMVTIAVGFFSPAMLVLYLAFLRPETVQALPEKVKAVLGRRRERRRRPASVGNTLDTAAVGAISEQPEEATTR